MNSGKIVVLGTGGTIAGTARLAGDNIGYTAAQLGVQDLLAGIPALENLHAVTEQVAQVDSKDMGPQVWRDLAMRCAHWLAQADVLGIVITHGTDTLEETAYFLQAVLSPRKPVVLTCAMRPATALVPDGPQNLVDAFTVARAAGASGVVAVCAGVIHSAWDVRKVHPYRVDAFSSGDAGAIGYVEDGALRLVRNWPQARSGWTFDAMQNIANGAPWPQVEIAMSHAGAGGAVVDALAAQGVAGIVVAATGNGTLHHDLEAALVAAQAKGVRIVRSTRCEQGRVLGHAGDVFPHSQGLSPVKARIALMLELLA